jgi:hypothetical protein
MISFSFLPVCILLGKKKKIKKKKRKKLEPGGEKTFFIN